MVLCTWDWGVIGSLSGAGATLIAAGVAWHIFTQWKNQKAHEVVANEAKVLINEVFELNRLFLELVNFHFDDSQELKMKINNFISLNYGIGAKLSFIKKTVSENEEINRSIENFHKINKDLIYIFTSNIDHREIDISLFRSRVRLVEQDEDKKFNFFMNSCGLILEHCKDIAMYKVKIQK